MELVPRFARDAFGPGDVVDGVYEVREPLDNLRRLDASLRYLDRSPDFTNWQPEGPLQPIHEGPADVGDEIPFAFPLPPDALPNWEHPSTEDIGTLRWGLVAETDIARGLDHILMHRIPVRNGGPWPGPPPTAEPELVASGAKWDVMIAPDRFALRRGESLNVEVAIAQPDAGRDSIELALMCQASFSIEYTTTTNGDTDVRREWRYRVLFEERPPLDPSKPTQRVTFTIPADRPFSYDDGRAFRVRWFVVAKEDKRWRSDPHLSGRLEVLP